MTQTTIQCTRLSGNGLKYLTLCIQTNMKMKDIRFVLAKRLKIKENEIVFYLDNTKNVKVDLEKTYMNYNTFHEIYFDDTSQLYSKTPVHFFTQFLQFPAIHALIRGLKS